MKRTGVTVGPEHDARPAWRAERWVVAVALCVLWAAWLPPAWQQARAAIPLAQGAQIARPDAGQPRQMIAVSWDRPVGRWVRRTERLLGRAAASVGLIAKTLLWVLGSTLAFLVWTAAVSALDWRMLRELFVQPRALGRELALGPQVFLRLVRDWNAPLLARTGLVAAWAYWVVPIDLVSDEGIPVGLFDDAAVAALLGKAFLWLCPQQLVQRAAKRVLRSEA